MLDDNDPRPKARRRGRDRNMPEVRFEVADVKRSPNGGMIGTFSLEIQGKSGAAFARLVGFKLFQSTRPPRDDGGEQRFMKPPSRKSDAGWLDILSFEGEGGKRFRAWLTAQALTALDALPPLGADDGGPKDVPADDEF